MGKTKRHETGDFDDDGQTVNFRSKRKSKQSRKQRKSKANLQLIVGLQSQRHVPNEETLAAMHEPMDCLGFDTVDEMLKELHDSPSEELQRDVNDEQNNAEKC